MFAERADEAVLHASEQLWRPKIMTPNFLRQDEWRPQ